MGHGTWDMGQGATYASELHCAFSNSSSNAAMSTKRSGERCQSPAQAGPQTVRPSDLSLWPTTTHGFGSGSAQSAVPCTEYAARSAPKNPRPADFETRSSHLPRSAPTSPPLLLSNHRPHTTFGPQKRLPAPCLPFPHRIRLFFLSYCYPPSRPSFLLASTCFAFAFIHYLGLSLDDSQFMRQ
ncbi:hypothetical protein M430DRAFT_154062 [Amorphotheca resinae ATCC 22711]|uniref:Uncharacterized protein n=1 Tax=Amorphotheca resinae ATCC 22711 TaxID=857342 RepID=A0A2T3BDF9_AMORE|nr:hypothetical protein M430DRAFT_154062 [Amorphotheca resinae ATCC 22711]PSS27426.1 hypothetical protein M430DRAFT_154062 [Amorphotheca resinae ATCC 22711]